jgi:beta-lactamase regulating signal transducer with metallopeptidase domain
MFILPLATIYRISLTDSTQSKEVAANNLTKRQELRSAIGINIRIGDDRGVPESSTPTQQQIKFGIFQLLPAILTICWLIGVFLLSLRLLIGLNQTRKISNQDRQPVAEYWQVMLKGLAQQLNIAKPVAIFQSAMVEVPTVIGWLTPIILLPPSALIGLTPGQLELILVHELAHIRRYDYFVNLLQTVIETLLFYHPAVWWVSHQIRLEREQACDDLVLEICGHPLVYARALTKLERLRQANPKLAMTANGGSLMKRINRILETSNSNPLSSRRSTTFLAAGTTILMAILSLYFSIEAIPLEKSTEKSNVKNIIESSLKTTKEVKLTNRPLANKTDKTAQLIIKDSTAGEDQEYSQGCPIC